MSTYYLFTSEIKDKDGNWININRVHNNKLAETLYGQSCMYGVYMLLRDYAKIIDDYDKALVKYCFTDDDGTVYDFETYGVAISDIEKIIKNHKPNCGYVPIDQIRMHEEQYTDIYDYLTITEYSQITDSELKSHYKYYEWEYSNSAFPFLKEILEHHKWLVYDYKESHEIYYEDLESRIVFFAD